MKKFQVTVNGNIYEVEVAEVGTGVSTPVVAAPVASAPVVVAAPIVGVLGMAALVAPLPNL